MKNKFLLIVVLFMAGSAAAQGVVHVKGVKSFELGAGVSKYGMLYFGSYVQYFSKKVYGKATAFYESSEDSGIKFSSYGGDFAAAYNVLTFGEGFYINGIAGATASFDKVTEGAETYDVSQKFKVGALLGAEIEYFITYKFVFVAGVDQRIYFGDAFGNGPRAYYRGGIRFNF